LHKQIQISLRVGLSNVFPDHAGVDNESMVALAVAE
jgi:hypothetical protein